MKNWILYWHMDPWIILFIIALVWFYFSSLKNAHNGHPVLFWTGILLFVIATLSPLNFFAGHFYFSAHMIAHVIILLIAGPLIIASVPAPELLIKKSMLNRFSALIHGQPWIAWIAGVMIMWIWHIPSVFKYAHGQMSHTTSYLPVLQNGSMLIAGMIFSWPLLGPVKRFLIHPLAGVIYLFTACISCSLLGLLIAFAPPGIYSNVMPLMQTHLSGVAPGITTNTNDLQAAGLIMWVPCCLVYLSGCFYLLSRYFNQKTLPGESPEYLTN